MFLIITLIFIGYALSVASLLLAFFEDQSLWIIAYAFFWLLPFLMIRKCQLGSLNVKNSVIDALTYPIDFVVLCITVLTFVKSAHIAVFIALIWVCGVFIRRSEIKKLNRRHGQEA